MPTWYQAVIGKKMRANSSTDKLTAVGGEAVEFWIF